MNIVDTTIGAVTLAVLLGAYLWFVRRETLGALSLPCVTIMTGVIYFYVMPTAAIASGHDEFFGQYLVSLRTVHLAVALYMAGALAACALMNRWLAEAPAPRAEDPPLSRVVMTILGSLALVGVGAQIALGRLALFRENLDTLDPTAGANLNFLASAFNLLVPLTLVLAVRDRFRLRTLVLAGVVMLLFLQVGFRFRILILASALLSAWLLAHRTKVRTWMVLVGAVIALMMINAVGVARSYGGGLDLTRFEGMSVADTLNAYGGEVGIVFVAAEVTENPPSEFVTVEPWAVGFGNLIPRALWPDKPTASYLSAYANGFIAPGADEAGIAAPQIVEMFWQFGWPGLPILAFGYFALVMLLASRINRLGYDGRVAGLAMIPSFFGYYMQTRGYFAQILADGIFMFGPLFLLYLRFGARSQTRAPVAA